MIENSDTIAVDMSQSLKSLTQLAEEGNVIAAHYLALRYTRGEGCKPNAGKASYFANLVNAAARHGNAEAQYFMYQLSFGIIGDRELDQSDIEELANFWLMRAAESGHPDALEVMGERLHGWGLKKDAAIYLDRAIEQGHAAAMYVRAIYLMREGKGEEEYVKLLQMSCERDFLDACDVLDTMKEDRNQTED